MNDTIRETRPERIEISPEEIEHYMREGRRLRSEMAGMLFQNLAKAIGSTFSSLLQSARNIWAAPDSHPTGKPSLEA